MFPTNLLFLVHTALLTTSYAAFLNVRDDETLIAGASLRAWNDLNTTIGGRLHVGEPFEKACFSTFNGNPINPDASACSALQQNYTNPLFRVQQFGAYMLPQWETCQATGDGCLLDSSNPSNPVAFTGVNCQNGNVPPFYIDVQTVSDIQAALKFSRATGVRLSVKNHGHDYKGRSSGKNTLSLWVQNLEASKGGTFTEDVYNFADQHNVTWIGGYHQTIGTGWVLGGGHSILSPVYGLGVDRVVQFKVVTPDGVYRTANECENSDLFWALRGGGGSAFGVVVESTHKVEPQLTLQAAIIRFPANSSNLFPWYNLTVEHSLRWAQNGWGGHIVGPTLIHVTPNLNASQAQVDMQAAIDYAVANGGTGIIDTLPSWNAFFLKYVTSAQAAVGPELMLGTRLISTELFNSTTGKQQLSNAIKDVLSFASPYIVAGTPFLMNQYQQVTSHIQAFRDITPGSGAYFNEGDVYEPDHEESYWGTENYKRLLSVKKKYDPHQSPHMLAVCWVEWGQ
ncbi:hypothetical protein NLI96_g878 [Meripilus lineatus]|uniref:FAD-binding PCMH-type domain-containing protein n=1 Tax=Meripilus lineatus TaxID=2056292 RepID=A0AAD5VD12_9APHY|nr:hypothetical protein NLI96_g878 [Physisporinus lineatus]